ncbi:MAG: cation-transporting P-type ATPase, partial [Hyphomicrobiaceae bacterium]
MIKPSAHQCADADSGGPENDRAAWHCLSADATLEHLDSKEQGLSHQAAADRLARYGANVLPDQERRRWWRMLLEQLIDALIVVL